MKLQTHAQVMYKPDTMRERTSLRPKPLYRIAMLPVLRVSALDYCFQGGGG